MIDGYARLALARRQGRETIPCIEYDLSQVEALEMFLQKHRPAKGVIPFLRILLALDFESAFRERALANQRLGGREKDWSTLTKAEPIHVRREIARVAGVGVGNVTKVKQLMKTAAPEIQQALRKGEISIHRAWLWSNDPVTVQTEMLRRYRLDKRLLPPIARLASRRRQQIQSGDLKALFATHGLENLFNYVAEAARSGDLAIAVTDDPSNQIVIPPHLVDRFRKQREIDSNAE